MSLSEHILELLIEGKVRVARGRRLKLGKYRIVGRYARVRRLGSSLSPPAGPLEVVVILLQPRGRPTGASHRPLRACP
ncbi:hypothetical protein [Infirmifilum sp. SLHALR2]